MSSQIVFDIKPLKDRDGKAYYGCFPTFPATIRLDEVVFFIFVSESGEENLVIRKREEPKGNGKKGWQESDYEGDNR